MYLRMPSQHLGQDLTAAFRARQQAATQAQAQQLEAQRIAAGLPAPLPPLQIPEPTPLPGWVPVVAGVAGIGMLLLIGVAVLRRK